MCFTSETTLSAEPEVTSLTIKQVFLEYLLRSLSQLL